MCPLRVYLEVTGYDMSSMLVRLSFNSYGMSRHKSSHTNGAVVGRVAQSV